ncbi:MAG: DUF1937 family protein [Gallionella sp.]|nr:DUF1937 family protein [Gallionella sp.]
MSYSYLASPYTNPDNPDDRLYCEQRFAEAVHAAAKLMARGENIFCPIAHSHPVAAYLPADLRCNHQFWLTQDFALLEKADKLIVLHLHQWHRSYGVEQEIKFALKHGIPIVHLDPADL